MKWTFKSILKNSHSWKHPRQGAPCNTIYSRTRHWHFADDPFFIFEMMLFLKWEMNAQGGGSWAYTAVKCNLPFQWQRGCTLAPGISVAYNYQDGVAGLLPRKINSQKVQFCVWGRLQTTVLPQCPLMCLWAFNLQNKKAGLEERTRMTFAFQDQ